MASKCVVVWEFFRVLTSVSVWLNSRLPDWLTHYSIYFHPNSNLDLKSKELVGLCFIVSNIAVRSGLSSTSHLGCTSLVLTSPPYGWVKRSSLKTANRHHALGGNIKNHEPSCFYWLSSFYFVLVSSESSSHRPKRYHTSPTVLFCSIHLAINPVLLKGCKLRPLPYWETMCLCVEAVSR